MRQILSNANRIGMDTKETPTSTTGNVFVKSRRCRICNDKATGSNFNVLSCTPCRIFFHRNASFAESLKCPKEGKCEIDFITRKICPKCRLDKCFANGMKRKAQKPPSTFATTNQPHSPTDTLNEFTFASQTDSSSGNSVLSEQYHQTSVITHGSLHLGKL